MVTSDQLLQLIAHLQHSGDSVHARNVLLKYVRKHSTAQLAILFVLDQQGQLLIPLAYNGKLPLISSPNPYPNSSINFASLVKQRTIASISLNGLFASALLTQGLLHVPNIEQDTRTLPQEYVWTYPGGSVLLNVLKAGDQPQSKQGVLVVCFMAENKDAHATVNESDILVCSLLLSAYLTKDEQSTSKGTAISAHTTRSRRATKQKEVDRAALELLQKPQVEQQGTFPELMYSLSTLADLYEIGLMLGSHIEAHELYQHILSHLSHVIHAPCACLLLYHPSLRRLLPAARLGDELSSILLVNAIDGIEMERLSMLGPGEILSSFTSGEQHILLVTLSCNCALLGIVALMLNDENPLSEERGLLLTYMGNVAALLLRNHSVHSKELQVVVEHERNRIARDIHDGAAQQIAHVLHKLEFVQRLLEKQALWPHLLETALIEIERAYSLLEVGLTDLRHGISSLLPVQLEEQGFVVALHNLLDEHMINDPSLEIIYKIDDPNSLPATLEAPIFRFVQEALTNVRKHARATRVAIHIKMTSHALVVEVHDNGIGIQPELVPAQRLATAEASEEVPHLGMRTMRERIQEAGGNLEVQSNASDGTSIRARFPLANSVQLLTSREYEVLHLIVDGLTNRDIAQKLSISLETVKSHVHHIMQKMQVKDRTQAAVLATRQGWL